MSKMVANTWASTVPLSLTLGIYLDHVTSHLTSQLGSEQGALSANAHDEDILGFFHDFHRLSQTNYIILSLKNQL